jgi:hypothetical protein
MASLHDDEIRRAVRANGVRKHGESLPRHKVSGGIDALIRQLLNTPKGRAPNAESMIELFNGRASFAAIVQWRFGWKTPPAWAGDLLRSRIAARRLELDRFDASIPRRGAGSGERGKRHLAAWRERKARERDEKEKAANEAASNQKPD